MNNYYGLDLGCANLVLSESEKGIIYREPSVIAVHKRNGNVLAVGEEVHTADPSFDQSNVALTRPFRHGIVSDCDITYHVIASVLKKNISKLHGSSLLISVPCDLDDICQSALIEIALRTGIKTCHTVYSPIAAMAGAFINPYTDCLIVDIGAVRTNIMLICGGQMIFKKTVAVGGEQFDKAIAEYVLSHHKAHISMKSAEEVKLSAATLWDMDKKKVCTVNAKSLEMNKMIKISISSDDLLEAFETPVANILDTICVAISQIPLRFISSVFENGIFVCGGCAMINGLPEMISNITGVRTVVAENAGDVIGIGLSRIGEWLTKPFPFGVKNISEYYIKNFITDK